MFLLFLMTVIAAMNAYLFLRLIAAFRLPLGWKLAALAFLVLMVLGRFFVRLLERRGWQSAADGVSLVSFLWLAIVFWFFFAGAALDVWNVLCRLVSLAAPAAGKLVVPARAGFMGISALVLVACAWGWFEAANIRVNEVTVEVQELPIGMQTLRIAQVTDVHVGSPRDAARLAKAAEIIGRLHADIIVSTGDLVDGDLDNIFHHAEMLRGLDAPLGKYAVFGNHEFYTGVENSVRFHEVAGFRLLRGQTAEPAPGLMLVGVDDAFWHGGAGSHTDERPLLPARPHQGLVVLLKHQPVVADEAVGRFDIQLSGHTHGGQIFPFYAITRMMYRYGPGLHDLGEGSRLFVSRGTGTWGPPLRLASPPEITFITFRRTKS